MCFSAAASFGVSAALVPAGIFCTQRSIRHNRAYLPLAVLPLIFAVQQTSEGFVWYGIEQSDADLVRAASLVFLFFAIPFWLVWVPFCVLFIEPRRGRKVFFAAVALCGLIVGSIVYLPAVIYPDILQTAVVHHSIQYNIASWPIFQHVDHLLWQVVYITIVASPLLGSSRSKMVLAFGIVLVLLAAACYLFYAYAFASVWCFFAAIMSFFMCFCFGKLPAPSAVRAET